MKLSPHDSEGFRRERSRALVNERVRETFRRLPLLLGFSFDHELGLADVEVSGWLSYASDDELYRAVDEELAVLVTELEDEEAAELLRGRTFARTLQ